MTLQIIRSFLILTFLVGLMGSSIELLLLGHTEEFWQFTPLVLQGVAVLNLIWYTISRSRTAMKLFRGLMWLFMAAAFTGLLLHYRGNVAFELEMYPNLGALELFWRAITGATPALAPGTMGFLGLVGWIYTFRHPVLLEKRAYPADITPDGTHTTSSLLK